MALRTVLFITALVLLVAAFAAPLSPAIAFAFSAVCHQGPARCFLWLGAPMPVCARCLGVYAGVLAAAAWPVRVPRAALAAVAGLNIADWLLKFAPNIPRFGLSFALCWLAAGALLHPGPSKDVASHQAAAPH